MLILNAADVRRALPMRETIEAMKHAYAALSAGRAEVPLRARLTIPSQEATALFMPAYVADDEGDADADSSALAIKVVTLFPNNIPAGLPFIHAAVLVMDAKNGQTLALLEGSTLTAIRTGAGVGAATDLLANPNCQYAAILGAGVQARAQLEAICAVRKIETVWIYTPNPASVQAFILEMQDRVSVKLVPAESPFGAIADAEIICTATTSTTPVFKDGGVWPGTHINGTGSYTSKMREIPPRTIDIARVFVDSRAACRAEAGELIRAARRGVFSWETATEIGEIILGQKPGRTSPREITFFKSVGVAVQDAVAAQLALKNARKMGLGQEVAW